MIDAIVKRSAVTHIAYLIIFIIMWHDL